MLFNVVCKKRKGGQITSQLELKELIMNVARMNIEQKSKLYIKGLILKLCLLRLIKLTFNSWSL